MRFKRVAGYSTAVLAFMVLLAVPAKGEPNRWEEWSALNPVGNLFPQIVGLQQVPVLDYLGYPTTSITNPSTGRGRVFYSTTDNQLHCLNNDGSSCLASAGGGGTVTSVTGTANQISVATGTTTPVLSIPLTFIAPGSVAGASFAAGSSPPSVTPGTGGVVVAGAGTAPTLTGLNGFYGSSANSCPELLKNGTDGGCLAGIGIAQTWSAAQTFNAGASCSSLGAGIGATNTGFWSESAGNILGVCANGTFVAAFVGTSPTALIFKSNAGIVWGTAAPDGTDDTGLSRLSAGVVSVDGATVGSATGTLQAGALKCGVLNTTSCILTGFGTTSGTATLTWPAVAGTTTNAIVSSNNFSAPGLVATAAGALSQSSLLVSGAPVTGGSGTTTFPLVYFNSGGAPTTFVTQGTVLGINAPSGFAGNVFDAHINGGTSIASIGSGGTFTNPGGSLNGSNGVATWNGYNTGGNCSSSASPAVCTSAAAGSFVVAAAATTIQVNTSRVSANSQILITEDSSLGTKLTVTCNTTTGRTYTVSARSAGASFTVTSSAAPSANPACLSYLVIN